MTKSHSTSPSRAAFELDMHLTNQTVLSHIAAPSPGLSTYRSVIGSCRGATPVNILWNLSPWVNHLVPHSCSQFASAVVPATFAAELSTQRSDHNPRKQDPWEDTTSNIPEFQK